MDYKNLTTKRTEEKEKTPPQLRSRGGRARWRRATEKKRGSCACELYCKDGKIIGILHPFKNSLTVMELLVV